MKRYLCFTFDDCDPRGGFDDFLNSFDELAVARAAIVHSNADFGQVVDSETGELLLRYEAGAGFRLPGTLPAVA
jgi:hypothetical protein